MPLPTDLRHTIRLLRRTPLFAAIAVISLAIGVAASTAIFSLADALLLRPRTGIATPQTLVDIGRTTDGKGFDNFSYPLFAALRERNTTLEGMAAARFGSEVMSLGDARTSERVYAGLVSGNYFEVLGTRAAAGRFFRPEDDRTPGTHPVVVLSHAFWVRRFNTDPGIIGRAIRLNNLPYTVVGVAEAGFTGTTFLGADFWVPTAMEQQVHADETSRLTNTASVWLMAIGRLRPAVTARQAQDELDAIAKAYLRDLGDERAKRWGIAAVTSARLPVPIYTPVVGFIAVLGLLTGLVLLTACTNVASMLLARALERRREVATRLAIGASRRRIVLQLLNEGLVLALLAAATSIPATIGLVRLLAAFQPSLPLPLALELRADPRVLGFGLLLATTTTLVFALLPALHATRFDIAPALHETTATAGRKRNWLRQSLVAAQVAIALLLLVAAGLFLRSLQEAADVHPGFTVNGVDTVQLDLRLAGYRGARAADAVDALIDRFEQIPGVNSAAASRMIPLQGGRLGLGRLRAPGYAGKDGTDRVDADWDIVSTDYFCALEIPIVRGRSFTAADREGAPFVAIINETMAARIWPDRDAVGQLLLQSASPSEDRPLRVVGIAKDAKYQSLSEPPRNFIYVPHAQQFMRDVVFYVRRAPERSRIAELRQAVLEFNPALPVVHAETFADAISLALFPQRLAAWIASSVGSVGLLLAGLGLYGVTSFSVTQRTREIALRIALGATGASVLQLILRRALVLAVIGGLVGLALATGVSVLLRSLLIGIQPVDPLAFAIALLLLSIVLLVAAWSPARRAAKMDPMQALRAE